MFLKFAHYFIDKAKKSAYIRSFFDSRIKVEKLERFGEFKDSFNNTFELRKGLRSIIKPGWENMYKDKMFDVSSDCLNQTAYNGKLAVNEMVPLINAFGKKIAGSTILEIGCHAGATAFSFAEKGGKEVFASEFTEYKVESIDSESVTKNKLVSVSEELTFLRNQLSIRYKEKDRVRFVEDDICNSTLPKNYFDIISSWQVLEHLHQPKKAFENIASLLKDDGIAIHAYNPFFCINGGHSLCTLDFLWGHVRLNEQDFTRYIEQIRPQEKEKALAFYQKGLNRMSIEDLKKYCAEAHLKILSLLFFHDKHNIKNLDYDILSQCQRNYPTLSFDDLITPIIILIVKKSS